MANLENWVEKQFDFDLPVSRYVEFLEYLRETPSRLEVLLESLAPELLIRRDGDSWSIQENAGHLLSLEDLFMGRLEDYINGAPSLRPADMQNNATEQANYNAKDIRWILDKFRSQREGYIYRLEALPPESFGKTAWHPRLNKPMRLCDMLLFEAEHDRHHLARIEELKSMGQS